MNIFSGQKIVVRLVEIKQQIMLALGISKTPIIVYQMGKVGSSSLYQSLILLRLKKPVFHVHMLNDLDEIENRIRASYANPKQTLSEINKGRKLLTLLKDEFIDKIMVVSCVRDPVARNISAFFQSITELIPDFYERHAKNSITQEDLTDLFLNNFAHNGPLDWFDSQMKNVFGVDVFQYDFPHESGYQIYTNKKVKLLVLRLENLNDCITSAMKDFFGIDDFNLKKVNLGEQKKYKDIYRDFVQRISLPNEYLNRMYKSQYAEHFYSPEEIEIARNKWSK